MIRIVLTICLFLVLFSTGCAIVPRSVWEPPVNFTERCWTANIRENAAFVTVPSVAGYVIGFPTLIITAPLGLISDVKPRKDSGGPDFSGLGVFFLGPGICACVVGTPFRFTKYLLYDVPLRVLGFQCDPSEVSESTTSTDVHLTLGMSIEDVQSRLGEPKSVETISNGNIRWSYDSIAESCSVVSEPLVGDNLEKSVAKDAQDAWLYKITEGRKRAQKQDCEFLKWHRTCGFVVEFDERKRISYFNSK